MFVISWGVRILPLIFLVVFALQNTALVVLQFVPGQSWQAPLIVVLLLVFALGLVAGVLLLLSTTIRQRREIAKLKLQCSRMTQGPPDFPSP